jgi:hypothetical protein
MYQVGDFEVVGAFPRREGFEHFGRWQRDGLNRAGGIRLRNGSLSLVRLIDRTAKASSRRFADSDPPIAWSFLCPATPRWQPPRSAVPDGGHHRLSRFRGSH